MPWKGCCGVGAAEVCRTLYERLTGYAPLLAVVTGVFDDPPKEQKGPYIVIGGFHQMEGRLIGGGERKGFVQLHIWSVHKGRQETLRVAELIDEALELVGDMFLFEEMEDFPDEESGWWHGVATYRAYFRQE